MKYYINYGTGEGNEYVDGTLDDAKRVAEQGTAYTQQNIYISEVSDDGLLSEVAMLPWYGVSADEDDVVTIDFGSFGFYGEWVKCNEW